MKKAIIAAVIAVSVSFTAHAGTVVKICDAAMTDVTGTHVFEYHKSYAVLADNGEQFSAVMGDVSLTSPLLTVSVDGGKVGAANDVIFVRMDGGVSYGVRERSDDAPMITFINCKSGVKS